MPSGPSVLVGKMSSLHWHRADSSPPWPLDPALAPQLFPVVVTHRGMGA